MNQTLILPGEVAMEQRGLLFSGRLCKGDRGLLGLKAQKIARATAFELGNLQDADIY